MKGLTPRLVESIFNNILNSSSDIEFTVKVSYMEIYMEKIRDLLNRIHFLYKLVVTIYKYTKINQKEFMFKIY